MTMDVIPVIVNIAMKELLINLTMHSQTSYPKFCIGIPAVRTDGRSVARAVYGHVINKFSRMGSFTYLWSSAIARVELHYYSNEKQQ